MLKAGAACLDITPPLGTLIPGYFHERRAGAVHDPLFVRAFALENGGSRIAREGRFFGSERPRQVLRYQPPATDSFG